MSTDSIMNEYFCEAASWDADRIFQSRRNLRVAWGVAAAGWVGSILAMVALVLLMPLKRVEPFLIRVDSSTGVVDSVPVFSGQATMSEAVTRYFLDHYVATCERFNLSTAESDYEECGAFHSARQNQLWYARWNRANPQSPLNTFKDGTTVQAQVTSISFFARGSGTQDLAQVRYLKSYRASGGAETQHSSWIATIQYSYVEPSSDAKTRRWNPLGFKVIDFQSEAETVDPNSSLQSSAAAQRSAEATRP
jgi:type IV secretion system protein VirB8